ncbi:MAG: Rha family transcriptional regulator, partial [Desulfovibrio sp.]
MPDSQIQVSVSLVEGRPATTSLKIAECFGKEHKNVLADIRNLLAECPEEFGRLNFQPSSYTNEQGKTQPMYIVFFDGFMLLVMGYTGKKALQMKLAYIEAFNAMREKLETKEKPQLAAGPDTPIGPADQNILQTIVKTKAFALAKASHKGGFPQIWSRFNNHFRLGSYKQ